MLRFVLGGLAALIVIGIGWIAVSGYLFSRAINDEVKTLAQSAKPSLQFVTEARLAELPAPVARHLRQAGVVGNAIPTRVALTQKGRIRSSADSSWMEFEAVEHFSTNPPGFVWKAYLPSKALPIVFGRDHYLGGDGAITMKMLGTFVVAEAGGGAEMNHASLMRYLNETMWFPAALAGSALVWTPVDELSADVSLTDRGITVSARLIFDAEGRLVNFVAERFNSATNAMNTWETPMSDYATFNRMTIPSKGMALYRTGETDFPYVEAEITGVTLD